MDKALKKYLKNGKFENVSETRSKAMAAVRGKGNRTTEQRLRFAMVSVGIQGWKVQPKGIIGKPDFVFEKEKLAIFVDGCYWHGCPKCGHIPKTRSEFWKAKIGRTKQRDLEKTNILENEGYRVLRFWEHELKKDLKECIKAINGKIKSLL
jgi:DNA mismatch endonuclease (patch repair protein)